eukprot:249178-Amphidinium_carterae.1
MILPDEEASVLLHCASLWPDSMVDKSSFMKMLLHVVNVEACEFQNNRWEEELTASGACNASGVVDVKRFVAFSLLEGIERAEHPVQGVLSKPQQEDERLAAPSALLNERLAAINTKPGGPFNPDRSLSISELSTAVIGEQIVVVDSKQYVLGERLGQGAGGSVFAATLMDVHPAGEERSHDPESMAL